MGEYEATRESRTRTRDRGALVGAPEPNRWRRDPKHGYPLKDICFPDTTPKFSFEIHFKHDYVFNLLWLYSKEV